MNLTARNRISTSTLLMCFIAGILVIATACGNGDDTARGEGTSVTGMVVSVTPRSLTEFELLAIVDSDGTRWEFAGGLFSGFTPSHLSEHMALGEPVTVFYTAEGGVLRALRIQDG
jgi:hypothetical protein